MTENKRKSIFELTPQERQIRLGEVTARAVQKAFDHDLPIPYQDERCPTENHFIHEYKDGRQLLVLLDVETMESKVIKDLTNA
jgi:hypothetical protein